MTARLHVLLGGGGVGKTTLAAGYALALAAGGGRVGLLGIDPSRRLQDALGVPLADLDAPVPGAGALRAAIAHPHQAIARWVAAAHPAPDAAARLAANPFFAALGDRLATATDLLAAARLVEWQERDPALTDLVIDTAPGVAVLDFLRAPRQLEALVHGRMVRWLLAAARPGESRIGGWIGFGARRVLGSFADLAGARTVTDLADFFALVRAPMEQMAARVVRAEQWLRAADTELLLVTSPSDTGAATARQLAHALTAERLAPRAVIVNRTWPAGLATELAGLVVPAAADSLVAYARAQLVAQTGVIAAAATWAPRLVCVPARGAVHGGGRAALAELGAELARVLGPDPRQLRSAS